MQRFLAVAGLTHGVTAGLTPSRSAAETSAFGIFNTVSDAMRQWGSSVHHNGLALMTAEVPRGTLFYHGGSDDKIPEGFEWLAFEIEHAQNFADSYHGSRRRGPPPTIPKDGEMGLPGRPGRFPGGSPQSTSSGDRPTPHKRSQNKNKFKKGKAASNTSDDEDDDKKGHRGYLHTYIANRPLKLLYTDGMAAAKSDFGPLDSQDLILMNLSVSQDHFGEYERAQGMCDLLHPWGIDGILRMEAGFEIIYCDFTDGLTQLVATRQPYPDTESWFGSVSSFQWLRAVAKRYDGIGGGRVRLGWGNAVTGWWYGFNTTTPDTTRPELHRFIQATKEERDAIRADVVNMAKDPFTPGVVDWQQVADMVTGRFAWRLKDLVREDLKPEDFVSLVMSTVAVYFDTPATEEDVNNVEAVSQKTAIDEAIQRCAGSFFPPVEPLKGGFTEVDELIYAAFKVVTKEICTSIFTTRSTLLTAAPQQLKPSSASKISPSFFPSIDEELLNHILIPAVPKAREMVKELMETLDWAEWKRCSGCKANEECFIAMFPFGTRNDHYMPACLNDTMQGNHGMRGQENYWWGDRRRPGGPPAEENPEEPVVIEPVREQVPIGEL